MTAPRRDRSRRGGWLAGVLGVVLVVGVGTSLVLPRPPGSDQTLVEHLALLTVFALYGACGLLVVRRQPRNGVGWLLAGIGLFPAVAVPLQTWADRLAVTGADLPPLAVAALWLNGWYWLPLIAFPLVFLPLLFPDGRLPSPRWRLPATIPTVAVAVLVVMGMFQPEVAGQESDVVVANPLGLSWMPGPESDAATVPLVGMLLGVLVGVAAVVVRLRRSDGLERRQMKTFLLGVAVLPVFLLTEVVPVGDTVADLLFVVSLACPPVAVAAAVLRYRLYDIDRLVSRTVSWGLLSVLLVSVYTGIVVATQAVLGLDRAPDLVVAGSTLAVAALFRPVRRRVQDAVDHRFNRRRTDAARAVTAFATRVRDEVDLTRLAGDLRHVADDAVQPAVVSLWLRPEASA